MSELTLEWKEAFKSRTEKILDQQFSKNPGTVRLGRHPDLCDLLFSEDEKISRLHAEIFFHREQNSFYLRKLAEGKRPLIVDGKIIIHGEVPLRQGSTILLGETEIKVVAVSVDLAYGLICPNIKCRNSDKRRIVDPKHLLEGCPWCGTSLAAAQSFHRL